MRKKTTAAIEKSGKRQQARHSFVWIMGALVHVLPEPSWKVGLFWEHSAARWQIEKAKKAWQRLYFCSRFGYSVSTLNPRPHFWPHTAPFRQFHLNQNLNFPPNLLCMLIRIATNYSQFFSNETTVSPREPPCFHLKTSLNWKNKATFVPWPRRVFKW